MKDHPVIERDDPQVEIASLVRTLQEAQLRLQELAGGEVDAVVLPGGQSYLLQDAQEQLRESEARFRSTFEQAAVGMAHVATDGRFLRVNDVLCTIVGYSRQELLELSFTDLTLPENIAESFTARRAMLAGEQSLYNAEKRYRRKDGTIIWVNLVTTLESSGEGGKKYFISVFVDITSRKQAEEDLAANEVLLRQFIQHTPAAIAMLDTQMCYVQTSERWMRDYHLTDLEIIGRSHYDIFPDAPQRWKAIHRRVLAGAVESCDEDCFPRSDGTMEWLQWEAFPWRRAGGEIGGLIFFTQVITARKQAELALRESEERFRQTSAQLAKILDSSLDVICVFDADGRFRQVSAACEKVWGYGPDELLGAPYLDHVYHEDQALTRVAAAEIMAGNPTSNFENRYVRKDGSVTYIMWSAWWSESDQSMFCVARDNTEARRAEADTRELAERLKLATQASRVGIWDWDITQGIMHWDDQMYALYAASAEDAVSGLELWQRHLHPDDSERANGEIAEALRPGGRQFDTSFRIMASSSGEIRHIRAQGLVFRNPAGEPRRMLGTNWNVTDQILREDMLREKLENERTLVRQALAGEKAKSEFLAVMSHEIRTPMNSILGFAEMLSQSSALSPADHDLSQTIMKSGEGLMRILDDILDFGGIEAGRLAIEKHPLSPRELVEDIRALYASQITAKGLQFHVSLDASLPATLLGDEGRIRQILINLLGNALKFTSSGFIRLDARASTDASLGRVLEFSISDTGVGVAPGQTDLVFEAFTQADSSFSRRYGGTGLGLAISRRLAELMGGDLVMASQPGEGTAFTLRVPFGTASDPATPPALSVDNNAPSMNADFAHRHPLRLLVVEDDSVNLKLIIAVLRKLGYETLSAHNGAEAAALYAQELPDFIFMDMQMPEMDGVEATAEIRTYEAAHNLRPAFISALTANILPEDRHRCLAAGMNMFLNKPVKRQAIANTLAEASNFRARESEIEAN